MDMVSKIDNDHTDDRLYYFWRSSCWMLMMFASGPRIVRPKEFP